LVCGEYSGAAIEGNQRGREAGEVRRDPTARGDSANTQGAE